MDYQFNSIGVNLTEILELNKEQTEKFSPSKKIKRLKNKRYRNLDKVDLHNIRTREDAEEFDDLENIDKEE